MGFVSGVAEEVERCVACQYGRICQVPITRGTYRELFDSTATPTRLHTSSSERRNRRYCPSRLTCLIGRSTNWRTHYRPPWRLPVAASIPRTLAVNHSTAIAAPSCRRCLCIDRGSKQSCSSRHLSLRNGQGAGDIVAAMRVGPSKALEAGRDWDWNWDAPQGPPRQQTRTFFCSARDGWSICYRDLIKGSQRGIWPLVRSGCNRDQI